MTKSISRKGTILWRAGVLAALVLAHFLSVNAQDPVQSPGTEQERLARQLRDGDEEQRIDAAARLGALFSATPGRMSEGAQAALQTGLQQDKSPVVRALSARALGLSGEPPVAAALLGALGRERQIPVRKAIIYALARYPSSTVTATLIPLLKDRNQENRAAAAYALAELNDPAARPALIELLQKRGRDEDAFARAQASRALGRFGGREAIEPLLRALARDKSQDVRRESAAALGLIAIQQDLKVIEALREATLSADPYLAIAADLALKQITARI